MENILKNNITKNESLWQFILFIAIVITALEAPWSFTFQTRIQNWQLISDGFISFIFLIDVIYQLRDKRKGKIKFSDQKERMRWFVVLSIDIIAIIPFDIIGHYLGAGSQLGALNLVRLFRLLRIIRIFSMLNNLTMVNKYVRLGIYFTVFITAVHWISCCWILINPIPLSDQTTHYIKAMYWTVTTLTTIGYGDITPTDNIGRIFTMIIMITGVGIYGIVIGNVSRLIVAGEKFKEETRQKMNDLASFMKYYNVPERLQNNVFNYYQHLLTKRLTDNDNRIIGELPHALQQEMQIYMNMKLIRNLPVFKNCSQACLKDVARALEQKYFGPGQTIINIGEVGQEMFIIGHGLVEVILQNGNTIATLHEGQSFGETALLKETKRNANVRAVSYCDLYRLEKDDFKQIINNHPELLKSIKPIGSKRESDK